MEEYQKLKQKEDEAFIKFTTFWAACTAEAAALGMSSAIDLLYDNKERNEEMEKTISECRLAGRRLRDYWKANKRRLNKEEAAQAEPMTLRQMIDDMIRTNRALIKFEQKHAAKHPKGKVSDCLLCKSEWEDLATTASRVRSTFDKHSKKRPAEWWTITRKNLKS